MRIASAIPDPRAAGPVWTAFFGARLLSQAAQSLFFAALILPSAAEGSAGELSATVIAMMVAAILLGYPGGALIDRIGPTRGMMTGSLARFAVVLAAFVLLDGSHWVWVFAFLYSAVSQLYSPAELAQVHRLRREEPCSVHASLLVMQYVGQGAGLLVLAPALLVIGGSGAMIAGAAVLFAGVAAISMLLKRLLGEQAVPADRQRHPLGLGRTLGFFGGEPGARYAAGLLAFADLSTRVMLVALPLYLRAELDVGTIQTGMLVAAGAAGVGLGLLWAGRSLSMRLAPRAMRLTMFAAVLSAVTLSGFGHVLSAIVEFGPLPAVAALDQPRPASFALALPAMLVLGASFSVAGIAARSVISQTAPMVHQGRIFASVGIFTDIVVIVPLALAGLTAELLGARPVLLIFGVSGLAVLVLLEVVTTGRRVPSLALAPESRPLPETESGAA